VNDYEHPDAIRYSINSLLGLAEAARAGRPGPSAAGSAPSPHSSSRAMTTTSSRARMRA
jgi:hypothetical protein